MRGNIPSLAKSPSKHALHIVVDQHTCASKPNMAIMRLQTPKSPDGLHAHFGLLRREAINSINPKP